MLRTEEIKFPKWPGGWLVGWLGGRGEWSVGESGNKAISACWSCSWAELGKINFSGWVAGLMDGWLS